MSVVVSVTFVPVPTEKGHPEIKIKINRHCTFAELKQGFVHQSPNFSAEIVSFKSDSGPIESDGELTAHLGSGNSAAIFYSTGM